jgi:large subunit ribosomal protein L17
LFTEIAPRYADRNGGYTRVLRIGKRAGDKAELAVIQFVEAGAPASAGKSEKRTRRVVKKSTAKKAGAESSGAEA